MVKERVVVGMAVVIAAVDSVVVIAASVTRSGVEDATVAEVGEVVFKDTVVVWRFRFSFADSVMPTFFCPPDCGTMSFISSLISFSTSSSWSALIQEKA